jgi:hypothetical protein
MHAPEIKVVQFLLEHVMIQRNSNAHQHDKENKGMRAKERMCVCARAQMQANCPIPSGPPGTWRWIVAQGKREEGVVY